MQTGSGNIFLRSSCSCERANAASEKSRGVGRTQGRRRTGNTRNTCSAGFLSCRWFNSGRGVTIKYNFQAARSKLSPRRHRASIRFHARGKTIARLKISVAVLDRYRFFQKKGLKRWRGSSVWKFFVRGAKSLSRKSLMSGWNIIFKLRAAYFYCRDIWFFMKRDERRVCTVDNGCCYAFVVPSIVVPRYRFFSSTDLNTFIRGRWRGSSATKFCL